MISYVIKIRRNIEVAKDRSYGNFPEIYRRRAARTSWKLYASGGISGPHCVRRLEPKYIQVRRSRWLRKMVAGQNWLTNNNVHGNKTSREFKKPIESLGPTWLLSLGKSPHADMCSKSKLMTLLQFLARNALLAK